MRIVRCHYCDGTGMVIDTALAPGEPLVLPQAPTPPVAAPRQELPPPMPQQPSAPVQGSVDEPPHPAIIGPGQYPPTNGGEWPPGACPKHGGDKWLQSKYNDGKYCGAKDDSQPKGYCGIKSGIVYNGMRVP